MIHVFQDFWEFWHVHIYQALSIEQKSLKSRLETDMNISPNCDTSSHLLATPVNQVRHIMMLSLTCKNVGITLSSAVSILSLSQPSEKRDWYTYACTRCRR